MNWYQRLNKTAAGRSTEEDIGPKDVSPEQLVKGTEVEFEHTEDESKSEDTGLDHLAEFPDYYTELVEMEKNLSGEDLKGVETVAIVLFRRNGKGYEVCIGKQIEGKPSNGQWVLPGGHVEDELPMDAAKRELKEEVGIDAPLSFYERNGKDAIFFGVVADGTSAEASSDLLSLKWVPVEKVPEMAWDQKDAVAGCLKRLKDV